MIAKLLVHATAQVFVFSLVSKVWTSEVPVKILFLVFFAYDRPSLQSNFILCNFLTQATLWAKGTPNCRVLSLKLLFVHVNFLI
jgi:hypothetical protein